MASAVAILTALGAGFGMCFATGKAVEAVARQPEAAGKIQTILLLGCALAESTAIYAFVVSLILSGK
ncbi:MAG: ATP synthase F0 subunit C [Clostridia bacterium]|nr:ATP synthase F0 subunit C [Clostridia bacterium]